MEEGILINELNVGEITWRNMPGQEFVPVGDNLCGVDILMATFARKNTCRIVFKLLRFKDGEKEELRTVEMPAADLKDNTWQGFRFKAIKDSAGSVFYFHIESPDAAEGNAVTLWANSSVAPDGYRMHINHQPVPGGICFKPNYSHPVDEKARSEWEEWGECELTAFAMMDGSRSEEDLRARGSRVVEILARAMSIGKEHRVLEIGSGVGRLSREMAPRVGHLTCADISENMLEHAGKRLAPFNNVSFVHLCEKNMPEFEDRTYDRIYSHLVFFHLPREIIFEYLRQISRLLSSGGMAYFDTWNLCHPDTFLRWGMEVEMYLSGKKPRAYNRFHTRMEMDLLVEKAGLNSVLVVEAPLLCYLVERNDEPARSGRWVDSHAEVISQLTELAVDYLKPARSLPGPA